MGTTSIGAGVVVKASGITVDCVVKGGATGMGGRERGRGEGAGNSPVVTCGGESEHKIDIRIELIWRYS